MSGPRMTSLRYVFLIVLALALVPVVGIGPGKPVIRAVRL